jgi:glutamate/tyrosine decarboxylase-like PLP-dependent enzyme
MRTQPEQLEAELARVMRLFVEHERSLDEAPVRPPGLSALAASFREDALAEEGIGVSDALTEFLARIAPGLSNTGLRDFGLVIGGSTPAAQIGDLLATLWDQCVILHDHDSIAPVVEDQTSLLLLDLFRLPRAGFTGTFTTGASASNLVALACARQWWGRRHDVDVAERGLSSLPAVEIYSAAPHSSTSKALAELGLGRAGLLRVDTLPGRAVISPDALDRALRASQSKGKIVVAGTGEVNTGDFDDLGRVAAICREHDAWLHVDAAFGLFARCAPTYEFLAAGVELADSITCDLHKLLNVPYDSGFVALAARHRGLFEEVFSAVAPYLGARASGAAAIHPMNRRVENSSRFRALPAWLTLKAYGQNGYRGFVERICSHAKAMGAWIAASDDYALLAEPVFNIVLFCGRSAHGAPIDRIEDNMALVRCVCEPGKVFMTPTVYQGRPALRMAFAKWQTTMKDVGIAQDALREGMRQYRKR